MRKVRPSGELALLADKSKPKVKIRRAPPLDARTGARVALGVSVFALLVAAPLAALALLQPQPAPSELSFEYLNLVEVPSEQFCKFLERHRAVNSLSLASNQIESIGPGAFVCIASRLKILSLRNNRIGTIADEAFKGLGQLQVLLLDGNLLKRLPSRPVAASSLPSLRHLNLAHNRISSIELADSLSGPNLISLNLRANPLEFLDTEALSGLTHLKTLILSELMLKTNHLKRLDGLGELNFVYLDELGKHLNSIDGQFCHSSRKLASLSLKWNQFESVPRFADCQELLSLDLSYNRIRGSLAGNFSQLTNLIDLYLGHNQLEYLEASAFEGLGRLQVLELNSNKIKRIHSDAFVPVRETLHELNVAYNMQLEELTANGLERLVSLKAHGNVRLRRLPTRLPSVRSLALTFAYHCCDYCHEEEQEGARPEAGNGTEPYPISAQLRDRGRVDSVGRGRLRPAAGHQESEYEDRDGERGRPGGWLVAQWSESIVSKLARLWRRRGEPDDGEVRLAPPEERANARNLSELVLWRPAPVGGSVPQATRGARRRRRAPETPPHESNLIRGLGDSDQPDEYSGVALNLHSRATRTSPELSEIETCANVIDELHRIRLAHADGGPGPSRLVAAKPISGQVDDVSDDSSRHNWRVSFESCAALVARELGARLLTTVSLGHGPQHTIKRDTGAQRPARRPPVKCLPQPDAFQPCRDLFDSIWLRASIWLVFLFAFTGNILVIVVQSSVRPSSSTSALTSIMWFNAAQSKRHIDVPRFLVINLAVADLLMALYLGLLAFIDLSTLGEFRQHAIKWQYSTSCQLAGFLAVLSSELSVFILAVITLERNYAITNAVHLNRRLSLQKAIAIMFFGYIYALTMALLPLNGINDYRKFSICLPLDFDSNNLHSSSSLYLVSLISINTLSFVLLLSCYLRMYCAIRGSQAWSTNDLKIAKRMSILVVTDFLCWSPIILAASFALGGHNLVGSEGLKVLIIFVLPLNSVANPFLYAITTKKFKRDLAALRKRLRLEHSLEIVARTLEAAGCRRRRDSTTSQHGGLRYRVSGGQKLQQHSGRVAVRRLAPTGCRVTLDETRAAASSKIQRARQDLLLVNESGHSVLVQGNAHSAADQTHRRAQFGSFDRRAPATAAHADKSTGPLTNRCAVCRSLLTVPPISAQGFDASSSSCSDFVAARMRIADEDRPKIVLDSVEPVLDVALAPLQLATAVESPIQNEERPQLPPISDERRRALVQCRQTSASEEELPLNQTSTNTMHDHKKRASSADKNPASHNFLLPIVSGGDILAGCRSYRADDSPETRPVSNIDKCQHAMATGSCLTVLINDRQHHQQASPNQTSMTSNYPEASLDEFRSVSACAYNWPLKSDTLQAQANEESNGSRPMITSGICCSCSSDMARNRTGPGLARNLTTSPQRRRNLASVSRFHSANTRQQPSDSQTRTSSISRFVIEPLARAWSSLQLSLQTAHQATATTIATTTPNQHSVTLKKPSQATGLTALALTNQKAHHAGQTFVARDHSLDDDLSESTERDELLVDLNEGDIIEDVLQMSSPRRRLLFRGRRMSRSCDVIVETSTTSTSAELTNSSFYDQNNDQRILLATINQLNSRSRKGQAKQLSFDQHNQRPAGHTQHVTGRSIGSRRLNCTRCRSWSPALLDKLEDCMHHIRNKIPKFANKDGEIAEAGDNGHPDQLGSEQQQAAMGASDARSGQQPISDVDRDQFIQSSLLQRSQLSAASSSSSSLDDPEAIADEEDEFNEIGLTDWTRNMQRKRHLNRYSKSASRRLKLRQQLSGNSDTLSIQTAGTTLTNVSFDSSSNIPTIVMGSLENAVQHLVSSSSAATSASSKAEYKSVKSRTRSSDEN